MAGLASLSARNPKVKELRRLLGRRSARREAGRFVVEGPTLVGDAIAAGLVLEAVYREEGTTGSGYPTGPEAPRVDPGIPVHVVGPGVLQQVGSTVAPQPLLAVVRCNDRSLDAAVAAAGARPVLVLAGVSDPGNAGTLLRSAEAAGAGAVVFAGNAVEPFNPKVVRASAGSLFRIPFTIETSLASAVSALRDAGRAILGTVAHGGVPHDRVDLVEPLALVLGNEAHGLPSTIEVDSFVTVPTEGRAESLNVAMAGTVVLFEAARQRRIGHSSSA